MADLSSLIRLHRHELDEKRRALGALYGALAELERERRALERDFDREKEAMNSAPDVHFTFPGYAKKVKARKEELEKAEDGLEKQVEAARDSMLETFGELKKYETTQEARDRLEEEERRLREGRALDEIGLEGFRRKEDGTALILILLAVAIFAALSFAVTQSTRGGGSTTKEEVILTAAEVIQHTALLKQTVDRLLLTGGCTVGMLSFYDATKPSSYYGDLNYMDPGVWTNGPVDYACNVYHASGGGLTPKLVPEGVGRLDAFTVPTAEFFASAYMPFIGYIKDVGTNFTGDSTQASELVIAVQMSRKDVCQKLNEMLGVMPANTDPPMNAGIYLNFLGIEGQINTAMSISIIVRSDWIPELDGKQAACFRNPYATGGGFLPANRYTFYQVLVAR